MSLSFGRFFFAASKFRTWLAHNIHALAVLVLCVPASIAPPYLIKIHHNPPVGAYIAIMGLLAAFVTFFELKRPEKAAWIALLTLLMVAEIRNLYVADADQIARFATISDGLDATKRGLDETANRIGTTTAVLKQSMEKSDKQFSATMERTDTLLTDITGGESYGVVVPMVGPNLLPGQDVPMAVEDHGGHILTGVSVTVYNTGLWLAGTRERILESVRNRRIVGTLHPKERLVLDLLVDPEKLMKLGNEAPTFRAFVYVAAQNFTIDETLDFRRDDSNHWRYRYKIYKAETPSYLESVSKTRSVPTPPPFLEAVDWSPDSNAPVHTTREQAEGWH